MISVKLITPYHGIPSGRMGQVIEPLKDSGPVWVQWEFERGVRLMRRSEIELIYTMGVDEVYIDLKHGG